MKRTQPREALAEYRRKRAADRTPEPFGARGARPRLFVVQQHAARRIHHDFRLEWKGVMLSWAVPRGPSYDTADKRMAMPTEDHPIEYNKFEGVIPEGEYGGGTVMIWDRGTWTPVDPDVDKALEKGELKFRLDGYKLKGSWVLVRTRGYGDGGKASWLLIKHKDEWAGPIDITEFAPLSVKTPNADLADILAADTPAIWHSNPPAKTGDTLRSRAAKAPAASPKRTAPRRNISQVVPANIRMNGSRRMNADSLPVIVIVAHTTQSDSGGWSK